uniref:Uncharacterized protein n=1 Tax=Anguilla anguilla TaxID=7936 RepID=A0A0E9UUX0_ANGAN
MDVTRAIPSPRTVLDRVPCTVKKFL